MTYSCTVGRKMYYGKFIKVICQKLLENDLTEGEFIVVDQSDGREFGVRYNAERDIWERHVAAVDITEEVPETAFEVLVPAQKLTVTVPEQEVGGVMVPEHDVEIEVPIHAARSMQAKKIITTTVPEHWVGLPATKGLRPRYSPPVPKIEKPPKGWE